jgi:class 3 adenylate cyclase
MPSCAVCEQENPAGARFCSACGAALTAEPRREERKVVSVLFADLVGFTSRAERLDPEDVPEQLAASGRTAEADVQSRRALAFYRAVGATRIVREAEKLLAAAS